MKKLLIFNFMILLTVFCFGQSNFTKGEELLMQNKPAQAVLYLENAVADASAASASASLTLLYLGIAYEQLGRNDEAIAVYRRLVPNAGNLSANAANNLANIYFKTGNMELAEQCYTQSISFNSLYSKAYLGRANTRLNSGDLRNAVLDYEKYMMMEPRSPQYKNIEQLVNLIKSEFAAEERKKILAEEEKRRAAEERQRLLDSVSASLQSVTDSSTVISSGAEGLEQYDGDFELD